ncbi:MAG: arylsulfatase, partial [Candidatus Aminicenantes bacterium]|nr:arylsulfatase [Candidatus Aminicenantes bacterium]
MSALKRREFLGAMARGAAGLGAVIAGGATLASFRCSSRRGASRQPNIVLIMADDLGYGDLGSYNSASRIPTPNTDALARRGVLLTDAHSPSAVCTPTRYGVLTGRYCWRTWLKRGVIGGYTLPLIEKDRATLASLLRSRGYATGFFGKWHLGLGWRRANGFTPTAADGERMFRGSWQDADPATGLNVVFSKPVLGGPVDHGFDAAYFTAACSTMDGPFVFIDGNRVTAIPDGQVSEFYDMTKGEEGSPRKGWIAPGFKLEEVDPRFTEKAIAFMEKTRAESPGKPFFVSLFLSSPHTPWLPPDFVKGKSQDGPRGDLVVLADWCAGEIVKALDKLGVADDSVVIFTSDNGPHPGTNGHSSAGPWRGLKSHIWEGGHRVPLIVRWPGRTQPGTTSSEPVCLVDFMATFAALAGAEMSADAGPDSYDISPAILGRPGRGPIREALVSHSEDGTFAIRQGNWKLILENKTSGGWMTPEGEPPVPGTPGQLYDLAADPAETHDLWDEQPDVVRRL